jgi:Protein of unknown function DUF262
MVKKKQPKIVPPVTWDDLVQAEKVLFSLHNSTDHVSPVNYFFKVGEKVIIGALCDAIVEEVLDGGKLLLVSYHDKGSRYGVPYDAGRKPRFFWWHDLHPVDTIKDTHFGRPRIFTQYSQTDLRSLIHTSYYRGFMDSPEYQREYVWTLADKQRLVRSLLERADIGKFLLLEHPYPENRLEVIDGKQRLAAIKDFVEGRYPYEGYTWFQFSQNDKFTFWDNMIQTATMQSDKVKKSDILWQFLSLNRGGVPQTEEHISKVKRLYEEAIEKEAK